MKKSIIKMKNMSSNNFINISILLFINYPLIQYFYQRVLQQVGITNSFFDLFITVLSYSMIICCLIISLYKNPKFVIKSTILVIVVLLISLLLNRDFFIERILIFLKFYLNCFSIFIIVYVQNDMRRTTQGIQVGCYFNTALTLIYYLMMFNNRKDFSIQGQTLSYILSFYSIIYILKISNKFNWNDFVGILVNLFIVIQLGSRTILGAILLYGAYKFIILFYKKYHMFFYKHRWKVIVISVCLIFLASILLLNMQSIASEMNEFLISRGIHNRFVRLLSEGNFISSSSGRFDSFYNVAFKGFLQNPLGYGFAYDRVLIYNYQLISATNLNLILFDGCYSHNFFIEILTNYGIVFSIVIVWFLLKKILISLKQKHIRDEIVALLFAGFFPLMLTSSVLVFKFFWMFLAFVLLAAKKRDNLYEEN